MYYSQPQLNVLIRSLQVNTVWERLFWLLKILGCRRRARKDYKDTPLAKVIAVEHRVAAAHIAIQYHYNTISRHIA